MQLSLLPFNLSSMTDSALVPPTFIHDICTNHSNRHNILYLSTSAAASA